MEMVEKPVYENWFLSNLPMTFMWNDKNFTIIAETADKQKTEFPVKRDRMIYWGVDASEIMLGRNGQVFFRTEE